MNEYDINDIRTIKQFSKETFSKYKKSEVKKALLNDLLKGNIEQSCYWGGEMLCSGYLMDLWETILLFTSKYIHLGNPKLPIYIQMRFANFKDILSKGYLGSELTIRNNDSIRKLFAELICILCISNKKHSFEQIKVGENDFNLILVKDKLKAPNTNYATNIFHSDDPKDFFIAINEFMYNIEIKNSVNACYWIEWIIEYESLCLKQKKKSVCKRRLYVKNDEKYQFDVIWLVWDAIIFYSKKNENKIIEKIIKNLLDLFVIHYKPSVKKRRRYILYYAISNITETVNLNINMIDNKNIVEKVSNNINKIYKEIKKSEIKPKTDYLFNGLKPTQKTNLEKTIEKLEHMDKLIY